MIGAKNFQRKAVIGHQEGLPKAAHQPKVDRGRGGQDFG
jgi:hypothetical protein